MTVSKLRDTLVSADGQPVRVLCGGQGPPVVLLHGFAVTADMWRLNLPALIEAGYSVLALDLPGHGASFRPRRPFCIADLARAVSAVIEAEVAGPVRLVGNSLGGAVASEIALQRPERVSHLVLVNALGLDPCVPVFKRANYWTDLLVPGAVQVLAGPRSWIWRRLSRMIYYAPERAPDGVTILRYPGGWRHNHVGRGWVGWGVFWQLATYRRRLAFAQRRAQLTVPTFILWGEDDQLLPVAHAYTGQALIPGARLHVFPQCGHAPNIEFADEFNRDVIAFFQTT